MKWKSRTKMGKLFGMNVKLFSNQEQAALDNNFLEGQVIKWRSAFWFICGCYFALITAVLVYCLWAIQANAAESILYPTDSIPAWTYDGSWHIDGYEMTTQNDLMTVSKQGCEWLVFQGEVMPCPVEVQLNCSWEGLKQTCKMSNQSKLF